MSKTSTVCLDKGCAGHPCESHRVQVLYAKAPQHRNRYGVHAHPCGTREGGGKGGGDGRGE